MTLEDLEKVSAIVSNIAATAASVTVIIIATTKKGEAPDAQTQGKEESD